jgi:hypothetical protein
MKYIYVVYTKGVAGFSSYYKADAVKVAQKYPESEIYRMNKSLFDEGGQFGWAPERFKECAERIY